MHVYYQQKNIARFLILNRQSENQGNSPIIKESICISNDKKRGKIFVQSISPEIHPLLILKSSFIIMKHITINHVRRFVDVVNVLVVCDEYCLISSILIAVAISALFIYEVENDILYIL